MKILFLCHRLPFPPNRGGKIRPFNMIRHLSQKHEVVVGSLAHSEQELSEGSGLAEYCAEVITEVVPDRIRWSQACLAMFSSKPSSVAYFSSPRLHQRVNRAARRISFDAVLVHCAFAAQYALEISARFRLMDFGDLDSGKWLDYSEWRSFPLSLGYRLEAHKLRSYEKLIAKSFDYCTVTTQGELEEFRKLSIERPHAVIPNGVDSSYFHRKEWSTPAAPIIVFVGRMDYYPNIDAVLYFAKQVLPIIRAVVPSVEFRIVGSNPSPAVQRLRAIPGVEVTGHVPDVRPYVTEASVAIAPLRLARGTQNKILESLALGMPVVATPQAAKGVQATHGHHLLVAEKPNQFAESVLHLLSDVKLRKTLGQAGRQQVENEHRWATSMKLLDEILAENVDKMH